MPLETRMCEVLNIYFTSYFLGHQIKEDEVDSVFSTHGEVGVSIKFYSGNLKERVAWEI